MAAHRQPAGSDREALIASLLQLLDSLPEAATVAVRTCRGEAATFLIPAKTPDTPRLIQPPPKGAEPDCRADILTVLHAAGRRLTTAQLLSALDRAGKLWGEKTVKRRLAEMVDDGWLDNDQQGDPPGYGPLPV